MSKCEPLSTIRHSLNFLYRYQFRVLNKVADVIFHKLVFFVWFSILTKIRHSLLLCGFQDFFGALRCFYIIKLRYQRGKPFDLRPTILSAAFFNIEHSSNIPRQASHGCAAATPPLRYLSCVCVASLLGATSLPDASLLPSSVHSLEVIFLMHV